MIKRRASANWQGTGMEGKGTLSTQTKVLDKTQYSFGSRFESGTGTNPEELIGAAHAGCFAMKLSFGLNAEGFTAENIDVNAVVNFDTDKGKITEIHLDVTAKIPGITNEKFQEIAKDAKENCPISKSLNADVTMEARLA
ncbi:MAG TPA: OsmC family protein [Ignavibacteria bacterium]|nr:OsmC family protein [Ignavibacteria bacterium]